MGQSDMVNHPDFADKPWCKRVFKDPDLEFIRHPNETTWKNKNGKATNTMFEYTLYSERGIRAHLSFRRRCKEADSILPWEECFLLSIGDGVDGAPGRAHGGFDSLILDHICGHCAHHASPSDLNPATATLTTDYKAPVSTPCVILARGWVIELSGRKIWVRAVLEDGDGKVLAAGKALFIAARPQKM